MEIAFFIESLKSGGKERQLYYLLKEITYKFNVHLFLFDNNIFYKEVFDLPIKIKVLKKNDKRSISKILNIYESLSNNNVKLIHSWDNSASIILIPYLIIHPSIRLVSSIRFAGKINRRIKEKLIDRASYLISKHIVSNSKKGLEVENLLNKKKGIVIHNGLDIHQFDISSSKNNNITDLLTEEYYLIVMLANFTEAKDHETFINVAKSLIRQIENIKFICIGDGSGRIKAENAAGKFCGRKIYFWGQRNDVPALLKKMDIGILLSNTQGHAEGISNAIMEYMAAQLPVIATNAGGTPELVKENVSGFLVPPFNENKVIEKINFLFNNKDVAKRMGENGRKIIIKEFNTKKMALAYSNLYSDSLKKFKY